MKRLLRRLIALFAAAFYPFIKSNSKMNNDDARTALERYHSKPNGSGIGNNRLVKPICDLQIIIPAYNVERYIRECVDSVLSQKTKYTYKIIIVEDGSKDGTASIVDEYLGDDRINVIHQENRGFSGARNRALENLFGNYIMFLDSDDMLCNGAIENLMDYAYTNKAQIVEGGMLRFDERTQFVCYKHDESGRFDYALGRLEGFPCGKVFRSDLFIGRKFPEHFWFEDTMLSFLIYPIVTEAYYIKQNVYKYRLNESSFSFTFKTNIKCLDSYWLTEQMLEDHKTLGLPISPLLFDKFFRQIVINYKRISKMNKEIKESVFILSRELLIKYFPNEEPSKKYRHLYKFMISKNIRAYNLFCKVN